MTENNETMVNELIEAKVALAKAEMQLDKKDHSKQKPEVMAPLFEAWAKAQAELDVDSANQTYSVW